MSSRVLVGTRKGFFIFRRSNQKWELEHRNFLGSEVNIVVCDPRDDALYACLHLGHFGSKVHRSRDHGKTWKEIGCPAYPPKPEDLEEKPNPMGEIPPPWKLHKIWSLVPGHPSQPGTLWCGTIPGGLFKSDDSGETWNLVRSLWEKEERYQWFGGGEDYPGIHSILLDPENEGTMTLGVSCGGVWRTEDNGDNWECRATGMIAEYMPPEHQDNPVIQDPHCVAHCYAAPEQLWAQHHNGVFKSVNAGEHWERIEGIDPSTFGFAVAVHPSDGGTVWLVPAESDEVRIPIDGKVVVTRTRDGGESWERLDNGLPQEDAYDLAFRHALDVDDSGNRVCFGSTTGSLWISENQGDAWTTLSENLPPIYCVRFAQ